MLLDDRQKAERLAKAILADIRLYNEDKIASLKKAGSFQAALAGLHDELEEGRALFDSRVAPALRTLFDEMVKKELGSLWLES
jgi:hypothetical protein